MATDERAALIGTLTEQMSQLADSDTKAWFENYLKGAIEYRGLKTPAVTKLVAAWRKEHVLGDWAVADQLLLCEGLIAGRFAEDKFAGTIYLQKYLLSKLTWQAVVDFCGGLFEQGYFFDWSTTDWLCVRVLDPTIVKHGLDAGRAIAAWRQAVPFWQRRASIVSFRHASADETFHPLIEAVIAELVLDERRFIQTGIGWVLADMSKVYPEKVESLFRQYIAELSKEVIDRHAKYLSAHKALKQLKRTLK